MNTRDFFYLCFHSSDASYWQHHSCPPLLSQAAEPLQDSYTGLTAPASASDPTISMTIRVRVYTVAHILLTSAWSHKRAWLRELCVRV